MGRGNRYANSSGGMGWPKVPEMNSRDKGARGERELGHFLQDRGLIHARRDGQQGDGGNYERPDVRGFPGHHIECKRVEERASGSVYDWLEQATRDAEGSGLIPIVFHRRNHKRWVV